MHYDMIIDIIDIVGKIVLSLFPTLGYVPGTTYTN